MALNVESLEVRLVPTSISLNAQGDLLIESPGNLNDMLQIQADVLSGKLTVTNPADGFSTQIPFTSFVNAKKLIVNTFGGNDFVQLMVSGGNLNLTPVIDAGDGNDVIEVSGNVMATNGDVSLIGDTIAILNNARIANFGTGDIHFQADQSITLQNGSRLETKGGNILLEANQGTSGSTLGNFVGIQLLGATIVASRNGASGTGNITLKGRGGDAAGGQQIGVSLDAGGGLQSIITGGSNSLLTIIGTGGPSSGSGNLGLSLANGSTISSAGGDVDVTGQGGGVGSSNINYGVQLKSGGQITSGGTGKVTVQGTGGGSTGTASVGNEVGIELEGNSRIMSSGGDVNVVGNGGGQGMSGNNFGLWLHLTGGLITAPGAGKVTVTGNGGSSSGAFNHGLLWEGSGSDITSGGGSVSVTGNATAGPDNFAMAVYRDNVVLDPATTSWNGGAGTVLIRPQTAGTPIDVGGPDVPGTLGLTDAELDRINAGQVMLGDPMSGVMTVSAAVTHANDLSLVSGAGITINQPITLSSNRILFAQVTGSGAIRLATSNADLSVSGMGMMSLSSANLETAIGSSMTTAGAPIALTANRMVLDGTADVGVGMIQLFTATAAKSIDLGTTVDPTGSLALSDAELDNLTSGTISIGNDKGGEIVISDTINRAAATHLFLATSQDSNISFSATGLLDAAGGDVSLLIGNLKQTNGTGAIRAGANTPQIIGNLVSLGARSGGIGDKTTALTFKANSLRTRTEGNGNQFLREFNSVTIAADGLTAGTGTITFAGGTFTLGGSDRISDGSDVALTNDVTLDLGPNNELIDQLQLLRGSIIGNGTLTGTSTFDLRSGSISANMAGKNVGVTKSADATVTLSGDNNSYTGPTIVTIGTLALVSKKDNNTISSSSTIRLDFGGALDVTGLDTAPTTGTLILAPRQTLQGTGNLAGNLIAQAGSTVSPGNSPGILRSGSVNLQAGSVFNVEVNGNRAGAEYDQLDVTGTVMLGGATLFLSGKVGSTPGQQIVIINNDGTDPVAGFFNNSGGVLLPEGASVSINGVKFILSYAGGAGGNDVTLTQLPVDAVPLLSILPAQGNVVEGDSGRIFSSFVVMLNKPSTQTITVDFATRLGDDPTFQRPDGIDASTPFATDVQGPWDFFKSSGRLTFDPGVTEQTLRVQIRPDDVPEANELFFVQLQSPVNASLAPQQSVGTAKILDDDSGPQLIISNTQILEGDSPGSHELLFTVQMIGDLPSNTDSATADYSTGNIAIDTAVAGSDYTATSGTLTFTNLDRFEVIHIPILGDSADESDKTLSVQLINPSVNLRLTQADAIGTIINDDSPNVVVSIAPLDAMPREGNSGTQLVPFVITLIGKPTADVTVNYATVGGTATAGSDYIATSGSVTFTLADIARGDIQKVVSVTVRGDTIVEPNETLNVALTLPASSPHTVSINPDLAVGRVVIRNDDQAILTEDGDAVFEKLSRELTAIFNAGGGLKSNPVLLAAMQTRAEQIIQTFHLIKAIVIILDPVDFVLTDTSGRQAGYTEQTGVVNQIPGAYYSGDGAVELLIVPLPPDGIYNVQLAGLGSDYNVSTTVLDNNGTSTQFNSQNLADGATSSFAFEVGGIRPIPVGQGLAANSGSASAFGVVGLFGQFGLRLALANGQENGELSGLDLDNLNERSFELMTWLTSTVRVARRQLLEPLWQSLESPLGNLLVDRLPLPTDIPPKVVDQFWSQIGQTLTGVPSGIYRLGNMLESLLPTLVPNRSRSTTPTPRAGEQGQPKSAPATPAVKAKRSALERPRSTPVPSPAGRGSN